MADINSKANIVLSVNGKQAKKVLQQLEKEATKLRQQIDAAAAAGDKVKTKKLNKELQRTENVINQIKGTTQSAEAVLARLDKASPRDLNKALRQLQKELNTIERGSKAWNEHTEKIRKVKAEISKMNMAMSASKPPSAWAKMSDWFNRFAGSIMAVVGALSGFVMGARKSVMAYADMVESMANTEKYTRMTKSQVKELNEIFKGMDTRIARDQLNLLAQEGGRLGYNTVQTVREYVEAAGIINVALCDLGEGATQTIAKLSNIFGIEQIYGVRDSMLKVGSTVNHLSQNCTAAKPFIVEFAQRMAGIGSVSKMTIPEIMAFAATLDAHGQKVEMSATALQRIIIELSKNSDDMARRVGINAKELTYAFRKDTTQGIIMFLEALNKLGKDKALAAMSTAFQDMGLDGARVTSVLANLSSHMGFLKWQLGEANQAFKEGTSASNEYAIFNNTVHAEISKAREKVHEIAIELGEKLYPIMRHVYTSSSIMLRTLRHIVDAVIALRVPLTVLGSLLAAYGLQMLWAGIKTRAATGALAIWNFTVSVGRNVLGLYKLALAVAVNSIEYFTNGLKVNHEMQQRWKNSLNAMNFSNWVAMIALIIGVIYKLYQAFANANTDKFRAKLEDITLSTQTYNEEVIKEQRNLDVLMGKLLAHRKGTEEYEKVKNTIISKYGKYISHLINEKNEIINLRNAYDLLTKAIRRTAQEKGILQAQQDIDTEYSKDLATKMAIFHKMLVSYGADEKMASYISEKVNTALVSGQRLDQSTANLIVKYSRNKPSTFNDGSKINFVDRALADTWLSKKFNEYFPADLGTDKYYWNPRNLFDTMWKNRQTYEEQSTILEGQLDAVAPYKDMPVNYMQDNLDALRKALDPKNLGSSKVKLWKEHIGMWMKDTIVMGQGAIKSLIEELLFEIDYKNASARVEEDLESDTVDMSHYTTERDEAAAERERKKREQQARKALKEKKDKIKGDFENTNAEIIKHYNQGKISYEEYLSSLETNEKGYFSELINLYRDAGMWEDEDYKKALQEQSEMYTKWTDRWHKFRLDNLKKEEKSEITKANTVYMNDEYKLQQVLFDIKIKYLKAYRDLYKKDSEEYMQFSNQITEATEEENLRILKLYEAKKQEWIKNYDILSAKDKAKVEKDLAAQMLQKKSITQDQYNEVITAIDKKYGVDLLPDEAKPTAANDKDVDAKQYKDKQAIIDKLEADGLITHEQALKARERLEDAYWASHVERAKSIEGTYFSMVANIYDAFKELFESTDGDTGKLLENLAKAGAAVVAILGAGFQAASEYMSACTDLEIAKVEKKYERELELAEGNSAETKEIEQKKQEEIAKLKEEAADKQFAMDLIMAVANTASNAIAAYGAGLEAGGPAGLVLGPIAAAMAVAAGAVQIATISKQREAAKTTGYSQGGFTKPGAVDEPAGIVHAGEWVASQKLVNSPKTRPIIEALEYAQRHNTIASLNMADVSRSITAPLHIASAPQPQIVTVKVDAQNNSETSNKELNDAIVKLSNKLNEPFVTVNTVTGDLGIKKAQENYQKLIRNKTPKSRR